MVLVPVQGGELYEPGGTDADDAGGGGDGREVALRVRFVPALGGGMVDGVPAYGRGRVGLSGASGRLHL